MKISAIQKLLFEAQTFDKVETLLYECNRENLVSTIIDHQSQSITFNQEVEVAQNLQKFGIKLQEAFQKVQDALSEGKERERIFMKVKEKMEQEINEVLKRKEDMIKMKVDLAQSQLDESKNLQDFLMKQQIEKERNFTEQQVKEEKER